METYILDFERPIVELEKKIQEMKDLSLNGEMKLNDEIARLEERVRKQRAD
ncbi:acetyl-CoA carboxylase carboxyl transferase subunit alpha, partial [candidate division KSB1 bacterium]|nr:acetyl-CoA carboxylase carboxyl transferase subunit alpha [candidate division KSB1 bacterium]